VVGDVRLARAGTLNAAGTVNDAGNRVDVDFRRITFSLDELLGAPLARVRKVIVPTQDPDAPQPANDITYAGPSSPLQSEAWPSPEPGRHHTRWAFSAAARLDQRPRGGGAPCVRSDT
jgi:hypothetical protein